jgi:DNA-binding HxlR family transcriptional regulator
VPKSHRYQLTKRGRELITAIAAAAAAETKKLAQAA